MSVVVRQVIESGLKLYALRTAASNFAHSRSRLLFGAAVRNGCPGGLAPGAHAATMASPHAGSSMARKIQVRHSTIHGNGVFAATDIPADTRLIEYKGRLLTHAQADR